MFDQAAKLLIVFGAFVIILGLILLFVDKIPFLGRLPGDFSFKSGNTRIHLPIATCIILSLMLTIMLNLVRRWK